MKKKYCNNCKCEIETFVDMCPYCGSFDLSLIGEKENNYNNIKVAIIIGILDIPAWIFGIVKMVIIKEKLFWPIMFSISGLIGVLWLFFFDEYAKIKAGFLTTDGTNLSPWAYNRDMTGAYVTSLAPQLIYIWAMMVD